MRVLLTGATGFVGRHLRAHLAEQGATVASLVRPQRTLHSRGDYPYDGKSGSVMAAVEHFCPDAVIHLATKYASDAENSLDELINVNIALPANLLHACSGRDTVKFIFAGSYWQFGNSMSDTALDVYAASKSALEQFSEYYAARHKLWISHLYLYGTYGDQDNRGKLLDYLIKEIAAGNPISLSPGEQKLDLVHVQDVAAAFYALLTSKLSAGIVHRYGAYSRQALSVKDLVALCSKHLEYQADARFGAKPYRSPELMSPQYPYPPVPGWHPTYKLEDYIRQKRPKIQA